MNIQSSSGKIQGSREYQQDQLYVAEPFSVSGEKAMAFAVADGMGSYHKSDIASQLVIKSFEEQLNLGLSDFNKDLQKVVHRATQYISDYVTTTDSQAKGMGSTLVGAIVVENTLRWLSVGDSELILIRAGKVTKLNADHSYAPLLMKMAEAGDMTFEEARTDPGRHTLRSVINHETTKLIEINEEGFELLEGDLVIIASDGINSITDEKLLSIYTDSTSIQSFVSQVLKEAETKEQQDNTAIIAFECVPEKTPKIEEKTPSFGYRHILSVFVAFSLLLAVGIYLYKPFDNSIERSARVQQSNNSEKIDFSISRLIRSNLVQIIPDSRTNRDGGASIEPFEILNTLVTWNMYQPCIDAKVCPQISLDSRRSIRTSGDSPALKILHSDITHYYLPWLKKVTGITFRLPSEVEWQYVLQGSPELILNKHSFLQVHSKVIEWINGCIEKSFVPMLFQSKTPLCAYSYGVRGIWNSAFSPVVEVKRLSVGEGKLVNNAGFRLVREIR